MNGRQLKTFVAFQDQLSLAATMVPRKQFRRIDARAEAPPIEEADPS